LKASATVGILNLSVKDVVASVCFELRHCIVAIVVMVDSSSHLVPVWW
jgi:hypothetical protein